MKKLIFALKKKVTKRKVNKEREERYTWTDNMIEVIKS